MNKNLNRINEVRKEKFLSDIINQFKSIDTQTSEDLSEYEVVTVIDDITDYLVNGDIDEEKLLNGHQKFLNTSNIESTPEDTSFLDTDTLIRYQYTGPVDGKNRDFCSYMMTTHRNDYFRREDINRMSFSGANNDFGIYSIWEFKGSYNCRHQWSAFVFRLKETPSGQPKTNVRRSASDSSLKNPKVPK